jgi:hypothetical protein
MAGFLATTEAFEIRLKENLAELLLEEVFKRLASIERP